MIEHTCQRRIVIKCVFRRRHTNPSKWRVRATYFNKQESHESTILRRKEVTNYKHIYIHTAAISSRSSLDKSGAIFTSNGGGPSSPHCISSRAACTLIEESVTGANFWTSFIINNIEQKKVHALSSIPSSQGPLTPFALEAYVTLGCWVMKH